MTTWRSASATGRRDAIAVLAWAGLVLVAAVAGAVLRGRGILIHAGAAPLFARISPHLGLGSLAAVAVAVGLIALAPVAAFRLPIRLLAPTTGAAAVVWTVALASVRGAAGITHPLDTPSEYLADVPRIVAIGPIHTWLAGFAQSIPATASDPWVTHVSGHPPGMTLVFVLLERAGLSGPVPAATACLIAWGVAIGAATATVGRVCGQDVARRAAPFLVLMPAVVWAGVSADALLAGAGATAMYLLALATDDGRARPARILLAGCSGIAFGGCCFLSYGAPLLAVPAVALLLVRRPSPRGAAELVGAVVTGGLLVILAFHLGGFDWWDGYTAVRGRYYAGYGGDRPYAYWVWADLAALAVAAGPAVAAGLGRGIRSGAPAGVRMLVLGASTAVLLAALSGMSKAEVERIWLPWVLWLPVACALLPVHRVRVWLAAQVLVALAVEHLLLTPW
jgi:hypothetical protein